MPNNLNLWLLDTHIWIRLLNGDSALADPVFLTGIAERSAADGLRLASISLWETAMLCAKGRLKLTLPVQEWLEKAVRMPGLSVVPMDPRIAADSCFLPGAFHGESADRLIVATARIIGAELITLDQAISDYGAAGWVRARGVKDAKPSNSSPSSGSPPPSAER